MIDIIYFLINHLFEWFIFSVLIIMCIGGITSDPGYNNITNNYIFKIMFIICLPVTLPVFLFIKFLK